MGARLIRSCGLVGVVFALLLGGSLASAQFGPPPAAAGPPPSPKEAAQVDLTGYWVALVTEDWLWRMITPPRGDTTSVPVNPGGRRMAGEWDPESDAANAEQCRPFGAAGLMRMPLRLHISWEDEKTLRIDTDAGEQTRLLHFDADAEPPAERSWQGFSSAKWTRPVSRGFDIRAVFGGGGAPPQGPPMGSLKIETNQLRTGYLRKNGLPYSEDTELTEYFSRVPGFGNDYLTTLTIVHDPVYLNEDFVTSSHFKREPDARNWNPSPCRTATPRVAGAGR
jgi:hypothetical protein